MFKWLFSISITEEWNHIQEQRKLHVYKGLIYARLIRMAIALIRDAVVLALLVKLFLL